MSARPFLLSFKPGTQRDGTIFDGDRYFDLLWARFRMGQPRKMGGYKQITDALNAISRRIHCFYKGGQIIAHIGTTAGIQQVIFAATDGSLISVVDRTPIGFTSGANIGFTMDAIFDTTSSAVQIVVHAVPDTSQLATAIPTVPFLGIIDASAPLLQFSDPGTLAGGGVWTQPNYTGGIVSVQPFLFGFSSDGWVQWSAPNLPLTLGVVGGTGGAGEARISAQKIVQGAPLRGGGSASPAALFWSLSEVITATFTIIAGQGTFAFNTISPSSSILSSDGVVEYDGLYFWPGIDRFLVFNGTINEVRNDQNQDWFFDNLTPGYEARTYGMKIPRYGEIWWFACMFGSPEPNWAIIFNLREQAWYDTPLPNSGRSSGYYAQGFRYPLMTGVENDGNGYSLWMHEFGLDEVRGTSFTAVRSYFETSFFGGPKNNPPDDASLSFAQLEPDLQQSGDLTITLIGAPNARAIPTEGAPVTLPLVPGTPQEQFASFTPVQSQRLTRLRVESNQVGGNYIAGRNLGRGQPEEKRVIG
jgi:hypothetical protein